MAPSKIITVRILLALTGLFFSRKLLQSLIAHIARRISLVKRTPKKTPETINLTANRETIVSVAPEPAPIDSPESASLRYFTRSYLSQTFSEEDRTWIEKILETWFDGDISVNYKKKWFCPAGSDQQRETDITITQEFQGLMRRAESGELEHWRSHPLSLVALVVLLDQFSRHIYRTQNTQQIKVNDNRALALARESAEVGWVWSPALSVPHFVFSLMPFRHSPTSDSLRWVLDKIDSRNQQDQEMQKLLEKFRAVTLRRLQDLEGKYVEGSTDILDPACREFEVSDTTISGAGLRLVQSVENFLLTHATDDRHLCVSLSGGVDSMVLARILIHLANTRPHFTFKVVCVHIDYQNRVESGLEANFLERWCETQGIIFLKEVVTEFKRGVTPREDYEIETRRIRFNKYIQVVREYGCGGVMFGHHQGDLQENVISNSMKGLSLLDLQGMAAASIVNQVMIWRPMLDHPKDDIFHFAHTFGVPYFRDTTPLWSTRGKLRTRLLPLLKEMYGEGVVANLSKIGHQSGEVRELVNSTIFQPFWDSVQRSPYCTWIDIFSYTDKPLFFWKEALRHVCHSMGIGLIRDKPMRELIERLQQGYGGSVPTTHSHTHNHDHAHNNQPGKNKNQDQEKEKKNNEKKNSNKGDEEKDKNQEEEEKEDEDKHATQEEKDQEQARRKKKAEERYLRRKTRVKEGWIELKPENRTLLAQGCLFIFNATAFPPKDDSSLKGKGKAKDRLKPKLHDGLEEVCWGMSEGNTFTVGTHQIGPWQVTISSEDGAPSLMTLMDVCSGDFSYRVQTAQTYHLVSPVKKKEWSSVDPKLRVTLPFLEPNTPQEKPAKSTTANPAAKTVSFSLVHCTFNPQL